MGRWTRFWRWLADMRSAELLQIILIIVGFWFAVGQLKGLNVQLAEARRSLQANTYMAFHQNLRELTAMAITDPSLLESGAEKRVSPRRRQEEKRRRYMGLFLAHARNAFVQKQLGAIPDSVWIAMTADLKGFFDNPEVREIWKARRKFQPEDFRRFIEDKIMTN